MRTFVAELEARYKMSENAVQNKVRVDFTEDMELHEIEGLFSAQLETEFEGLSFLEEERKKIGCPDSMGKVVMDVAWEQLMSNIAVKAGEDFIKDNRGFTLDLRNEAHVQTTENFTNGKIATHNDKINYQQRFDEWQDNFQRNDDGTIKTNADNPNYNGNKPDQQILRKDARVPFDNDRPKGSKSVHKDHTIPVAEIIRDPKANAHLEKQDQINFANSEINLGDLEASANASKQDLPMNEWLDSERNGEKPADRFDIDDAELRERERVAREEYERVTEAGKQKSIETGKQSQNEEALRITNKALRAVIMQLLAEFVKEIIKKLIQWLKNSSKSINTLLESIKLAITNFVSNLNKHLFNSATTVLTTVATAIFGPIVRTVRRVITMLKQGVKSLKEVFSYLKNPTNKKKPVSVLLLEVSKIVVVGASAVGTLALGEVIEKGLMTIPVFAFEIPLLGSLASLVGLLLGGLIMGIIGAIIINLIDKLIIKKLKAESTKEIIEKKNTIIGVQEKQMVVAEAITKNTKTTAFKEIKERHELVKQKIETAEKAISSDVYNEIIQNTIVVTENNSDFLQIQKELETLLQGE
jgi:hypothetical protein